MKKKDHRRFYWLVDENLELRRIKVLKSVSDDEYQIKEQYYEGKSVMEGHQTVFIFKHEAVQYMNSQKRTRQSMSKFRSR